MGEQHYTFLTNFFALPGIRTQQTDHRRGHVSVLVLVVYFQPEAAENTTNLSNKKNINSTTKY